MRLVSIYSEFESEEEDHVSPRDNAQNPVDAPTSFLEVIHHPHSGKRDATIIPLDLSTSDDSRKLLSFSRSNTEAKPWAPFRGREDFEFCETLVTQALNNETIQTFLNGFNGKWATGSNISLHTLADYHTSMEAARHFGVRVCLWYSCSRFDLIGY